jgi:hypothetical protein
MIALRRAGTGAQAVLLRGGTAVDTATFTLSAGDMKLGGVLPMRVGFTAYCDGSVLFSAAGKQYLFAGINVEGFIALYARSNATGSELAVDDFSLWSYGYKTANGKDVGINFKGTSTTVEYGEEIYEPYVNNQIWFMSGSGVSRPRDVSKQYLQMVSATGLVLFGPRNERYSEFIVRFDVRVNADIAANPNPANVGIGVSMGRRSLSVENKLATTVLLSYSGGATRISAYNALTAEGESSVPCDIHLWQDTTTVYNVMMIATNRTVRVYVKRGTDDESVMGILRAEFKDADTNGLVAVTCNTYDGKKGDFAVSNISVTNIGIER